MTIRFITDNDHLYSANSMWHVQVRFTFSMHEIEPKALKAPGSPYIVYMACGRGWITAPGIFPYSFREAHEFFKVPCIGLVKVERLGQRLNVPTQGQRVAQTGTKPFSLTALGSDPQPGIEHAALVRDRRANHSATWAPYWIICMYC